MLIFPECLRLHQPSCKKITLREPGVLIPRDAFRQEIEGLGLLGGAVSTILPHASFAWEG